MHLRLDISKKSYKNLVELPNEFLVKQLKEVLIPSNLPRIFSQASLFIKLNAEDVDFFTQRAASLGVTLSYLLSISAEVAGKVNHNLEKVYQLELQRRLGGQVEVQVPCGRIDLLTRDTIWEVKFSKNYKAAIGQALCYAVYKQGYKPGVALIGELSKQSKEIVERCCQALNIKLIWIPLTHDQ